MYGLYTRLKWTFYAIAPDFALCVMTKYLCCNFTGFDVNDQISMQAQNMDPTVGQRLGAISMMDGWS